MKPPHPSSPKSSGAPEDDLSDQPKSEPFASDDESEFEQALQEIEQALQALKACYAEVQQDSQQKRELEQQ